MFGQPRCREWTPLATQQLRTRNLLQIVGYNMRRGSLYYTLHSTAMSAPFYTSEKLLSNHPKWREIDSELIHKMSSLYIVVRVWRHIRHADDDKCQRRSDEIIQTWGVNFSGLLHIGANLTLEHSPKSFKENTLIFQMIGGYFCSYDKLRTEGTKEASGIRYPVSGSPTKRIPIDGKHRRNAKESKSVSPGRGIWRLDGFDSEGRVAKSHSPPDVSGFGRIPNHSPWRISADSVYEHSPKSEGDSEIREYSCSDSSNDNIKSCGSLTASNRDLSNIDESETAENFLENISPVPKCRYSSMKFLKSEIRPSYTAEKLQKLHLLQYSIKNKTRDVQEIKEKIYQRTAIENNENLSPGRALVDYEDFSRSEDLCVSSREFSFLTGKKYSKTKDLGKILSQVCSETTLLSDKKQKKENIAVEGGSSINTLSYDRRFTLPLNKLLQSKNQPSPSQRLRHACLTRQVELSRFKRRLLKDERDATLAKIRQLKEVRSKLFEENQDNGSDLMQKYHSLSRKTDQLKELRKSEDALGELCARSSSLLWGLRWKLVRDIQTIYPIEEDEEGKLRILDIHLPACQNDGDGLKQVPENHLAVALGYVSHVAALTASILAVPLRHPLRLMGSRTKVLDHLSDQQNEIALFARNKDSTMFRYGLFLLNKNIVQLLWTTHRIIPADPKDTLNNLRKLVVSAPQLNSLEMSQYCGSVSSVETVGVSGYGLCHQFSAPSLMPHLSSQSIMPSLNSSVSTGAIRKVPHHSLRSLVSVGGDRSTRSLMISGGFGNTGGRQFNRFKDSVNGHSPKTAMVIRKHRHSRSVGSYVDEQVLQSLEASPTSIIGSEPSLLIHETNNGDIILNEHSDSPSDDIQNVMSFSESDLTKVSGIGSSETVSPGEEEFGAKSEEKVMFSVGDDFESNFHTGKQQRPPRIPKQNSFEENLIESTTNDKDRYRKNLNEVSRLSKENLEIRNLQLDVDQLSKELKQLCSDSSPNDIIENDELAKSYTEICANKDLTIEISNVVTSCDTVISCKPNENIENAEVDATDVNNSNIISENKGPKDICDADGIMNDIIVLPSAEAVMTTSSHFNDTYNYFELNEEIVLTNNSKDKMNSDVRVVVKTKCCDISEKDSLDRSDANSINDYFDDTESICVGNNASHDANKLLEDLKLIEENGLTLEANIVSEQKKNSDDPAHLKNDNIMEDDVR